MGLRSCWKSRHKPDSGSVSAWFTPGFVALLWLFMTQLAGGVVGETTKTVVQKDAEFDVTYNDTVTSDNQIIYAFNHTISRNKVSRGGHNSPTFSTSVYDAMITAPPLSFSPSQTEGVRVTVDVLSEGLESPILFVVRQKQAVLSFQVPLILRGL